MACGDDSGDGDDGYVGTMSDYGIRFQARLKSFIYL